MITQKKRSTKSILNERSDTDLFIKDPLNIYINPDTFEWVAFTLGRNKNLVWGDADDFDHPTILYGCDYNIRNYAYFILDLIEILKRRGIFLAGSVQRSNQGMTNIRRMIMAIIAPEFETNNLEEDQWFTNNNDVLNMEHHDNVFYIFNQIMLNTVIAMEDEAVAAKNDYRASQINETRYSFISAWKNSVINEIDYFNLNTENEVSDWLKIRNTFTSIFHNYTLIKQRFKEILTVNINNEIESIMQKRIHVPLQMRSEFYMTTNGDMSLNVRLQVFIDRIKDFITHAMFTQKRGALRRCKSFTSCIADKTDNVCSVYGSTVHDDNTIHHMRAKDGEREDAKRKNALDYLL